MITAGYFIYRATLHQMALLRLNGQLPSYETHDAEDVLEANALLGDYSSDDEYDYDLGHNQPMSRGTTEDGVGRADDAKPGLRRSASKTGHTRQESV